MCWNGQGTMISTWRREGEVKPHQTPSLERFPMNWKGSHFSSSVFESPSPDNNAQNFALGGMFETAFGDQPPCPSSPTS
jgi:hypothetical protein